MWYKPGKVLQKRENNQANKSEQEKKKKEYAFQKLVISGL